MYKRFTKSWFFSEAITDENSNNEYGETTFSSIMDLYPQLYICGISIFEFKKLNMNEINLIIKGLGLVKEMESKERDMLAWQTGKYVKLAISSALDKKSKYPSKPFLFEEAKNNIQSEEDMINILDKFVSK